MQRKTLLASFGVRTLEILRAVKAGQPLNWVTVSRLDSIGWAKVSGDGRALLTVAGGEALDMLEKLDAISEEHAELLEELSGPPEDPTEIPEQVDVRASRSDPYGSN